MRTCPDATIRLSSIRAAAALFIGTVALASPLAAQPHHGVPDLPTVTVSASATTSLPNDRVQAWLRVEVEHANPATAAAQVNTAVARALARIRAVAGVKVATTGYTTHQITEKGKPARWRVTQGISLDSTDFGAVAALIGRLQDEDGLLLSGMSFSVTDEARAKAEDAVTQQALRAWQERAQASARGLGFPAWRPGRVTVQAGGGRPFPVMRAAAADAIAGAPVAVEAGTTDITVTVSGDAVLEPPRPPGAR